MRVFLVSNVFHFFFSFFFLLLNKVEALSMMVNIMGG